MDIMDKFSVFWKELMVKHKMSKSEMSRITGASRTTVYLWLKGERCPNFNQVNMLMKHLGKKITFVDEELL